MRKAFLILSMALLVPTTGRAADSTPAPSPVRYVYRVVGTDSLAAFVFSPPAGSKPANGILLFHGGGWVAGSADWVFASAERFAQYGMVAIAVDYRLSNDKITPIDALDDVCASFAWARTHAKELGIGGKIAGYGVSAGGHLLAASATVGCKGSSSAPDAMLLWSPAVDPAHDPWFQKLLQGRAQAIDLSPADHAGKSTCPACIVQGAEDTLTPVAGARRFCAAIIAAGGICDLHVYDGVGHMLTRNLKNQEDDFDPDPEKRADGIEQQRKFLVRLGFISSK